MATAAVKIKHGASECSGMLLPVRDALEVLNGKWKLPIIVALTFGPKRFKQISNEVKGITDKMLSPARINNRLRPYFLAGVIFSSKKLSKNSTWYLREFLQYSAL